MLFAILQEQHDKQIAEMMAMNKAMLEKMNALVASGGNKENTHPSGTNTAAAKTGGSKHTKAQQHQCPHCKKMVVHKAEHCFKLEANREKRFEGWKSALPTPA
jgi:hypothetical protein